MKKIPANYISHLALAVLAIVLFCLPAIADYYIDPKLSLSGDRLDTNDPVSGRVIVGTIANLGDGSCDIVLRLNLYTASNVLVKNRSARMNDVPSGGRWDFKIRVNNPEVASYEIKSVRAFWHDGRNAPKRQRFS